MDTGRQQVPRLRIASRGNNTSAHYYSAMLSVTMSAVCAAVLQSLPVSCHFRGCKVQDCKRRYIKWASFTFTFTITRVRWRIRWESKQSVQLLPFGYGFSPDNSSHRKTPKLYTSNLSVGFRWTLSQFSGGMWLTVPPLAVEVRLFVWVDEYSFHLERPKSQICKHVDNGWRISDC